VIGEPRDLAIPSLIPQKSLIQEVERRTKRSYSMKLNEFLKQLILRDIQFIPDELARIVLNEEKQEMTLGTLIKRLQVYQPEIIVNGLLCRDLLDAVSIQSYELSNPEK
jgi:hypothetical protein